MNRGILILAGVLLFAGLGFAAFTVGSALRSHDLAGTELEDRPSVADVTLVSGDGRELSLGDFQGRYVLVFFGYSRCPDVCPITMSRLGTIYRELGEPDDLEVVMITVDPEHDSPQVIDDYAKGFHPDFVGLGGGEEQLHAAARRFYVGANHDGHGGILHTSPVMLVDRDGRYWRVYNDDSQRYLEDDLRALLG